MRRAVVTLALLFGMALAAPASDLVSSLPLFNGTFPSKHYSGYAKGLGGSHLHYYLVVASDVDPAKAPFVFWTNGGPGCSSMDGWGYELGPFHFKNYGTDGPVFELNPYTWTKNATVVFVENPPGVGFSYRDDGNYTITDSMNAANNYAALMDLLHNKFPEFLNNTVYIAGESYGGIYVPTLAYEILTKGGVPNFAGIMVGNGVTSEYYDFNFFYSDATFAHGHGFMTDETLEAVRLACVPPQGAPSSELCGSFQSDYYGNMTPYVNTYDYTLSCFQAPQLSDLYLPAARRRIEVFARREGLTAKEYVLREQQRVKLGVPPSPQGAQVPCIDSETMTTYLNRADVKAALHVEPSLNWAICYDINYVQNIMDVVFVYDMLLLNGKKVLIYNGNLDMSVPYTGTEAWIKHQTTWQETRPLKGWSFHDAAYPYGPQQGGFAVQYQNLLWFTKINGAGHMVPQFRPPAALAMFLRFIGGEGF